MEKKFKFEIHMVNNTHSAVTVSSDKEKYTIEDLLNGVHTDERFIFIDGTAISLSNITYIIQIEESE